MSQQTDSRDKSHGAARTARRVAVSRADLPLRCPAPDGRLWDSHPRVFLPIEDTGEALCPYCGTLYVLQDGTPA